MGMTLVSPKLFRTYHHVPTNSGGHLAHWCPGCNQDHEFAIDRPFHNGARWSFDGNVDAPTFNPSMNIRVGPYPSRDDPSDKLEGHIDVCHYFLHGGRIQFLGDCTHALKGQTIDLPDLPPQILMRIRASAV